MGSTTSKPVEIEIQDPLMTRCPTVFKGKFKREGVSVRALMYICGGQALYDAETKRGYLPEDIITTSCRLIRLVESNVIHCECGAYFTSGTGEDHMKNCYWVQSGLVKKIKAEKAAKAAADDEAYRIKRRAEYEAKTRDKVMRLLAQVSVTLPSTPTNHVVSDNTQTVTGVAIIPSAPATVNTEVSHATSDTPPQHPHSVLPSAPPAHEQVRFHNSAPPGGPLFHEDVPPPPYTPN